MEDSYVLQLLKPKFKDFHLCFCGFAECEPLHSYGPAARPNYILHYVMKGKGIYQVGETKYQLKEGQAFLIEPESLTFYQADKKDPWSYLWVGFGGTEAQRFVRDLGLNSRQLTCECEYGKELKEIVFEMLRHMYSTAENPINKGFSGSRKDQMEFEKIFFSCLYSRFTCKFRKISYSHKI